MIAILASVMARPYPAGAESALHFQGWEMTLPAGLTVAQKTGDKLVLTGNSATITLYAPQPVNGDPSAWLDGRWRSFMAGKEVVFEGPPNEAALLDGTSGYRRTANVGDKGIGFVQADLYMMGNRGALFLAETQDEKGMGTYLNLFFSLKLDGSATPGGVQQPAISEASATQTQAAEVGPPSPLEPDPTENMDWEGPDVRVRTSYDLAEMNAQAGYREFLRRNDDLLGDVPQETLSFQQAMGFVDLLVNPARNAAYLQQVRVHPKLQTVERITAHAVSHLTLGSPAEGLAALRVAYEKWPQVPTVMYNMASILSGEGFAAESQALLDELVQSNNYPFVGSGIGPESAVDYLEGYNLMRMGDYEQASRKFSDALAASPDFPEANLGMALVEERQGRSGGMFWLSGVYRRSGSPMQTGYPDSPYEMHEKRSGREASGEGDVEVTFEDFDGNVGLPAIQFVDVSKGQPGNLPSVPRPSAPADTIGYHKWYSESQPAFQKKLERMDEQRRLFDARWRKKIQPGPRLEWYEAILRIVEEANARAPEMRVLMEDQSKADEELVEADRKLVESVFIRMEEIQRRYAGKPAVAACPDMRALVDQTHEHLRAYVRKLEVAARRTHGFWHQYATALAGMASDPDFRLYLQSHIELADEVTYQGLLANTYQTVKYFAVYEDCGELEKRAAEDAARQKVTLAPCDEKNKATRGYSVGPIKLESSCEGIKYGLEADLGLVKFGAEANFDKDGWLEGHTTKGKVGGDVVGGSVGGEVTTDKQGGFQSGKVTVEQGAVVTTKRELGWDNKGRMTVYEGTRAGAEGSIGPVKGGASYEEGSGYTMENGQVTSTFTKTVTETSAGLGPVGGSTKVEVTTAVPGPGVGRM